MQHFAAVKRKLSDDCATIYSLFAVSVFSELSFWGMASTFLDLHIPSFQSLVRQRQKVVMWPQRKATVAGIRALTAVSRPSEELVVWARVQSPGAGLNSIYKRQASCSSPSCSGRKQERVGHRRSIEVLWAGAFVELICSRN